MLSRLLIREDEGDISSDSDAEPILAPHDEVIDNGEDISHSRESRVASLPTDEDMPETHPGPSEKFRDRLTQIIGADKVKMLIGLGMIDEVEEILLTTLEADPSIMTIGDFVETTIELTLDSGCCDHVLDLADTPGYACILAPSPGSQAK